MTSNIILPWLHAGGQGGVRHSMQALEGDGTTGPFEFNFAGGAIDPAHIKAYRYDPASATSHPQAIDLIGPNQAVTSEAIPQGQYLVIYRDTPKDLPLVDYTEGAVMDEANLDTTARQAVFAAAEMVDRFEAINATVSDAVARTTDAMSTADAVLAAAQAASDVAASAAAAATAAAGEAQAAWADISTKFTVSPLPPSGGKDGDIWFQVTS